MNIKELACSIKKITSKDFYAVGGSTRNKFLNINDDSDIDLTSACTPNELIDILKSLNIKFFTLGIEHGTIRIILNDVIYEHTTFRKDIKTFGRKAIVEFTTKLEEDALRRDFTFNAIYQNIITEEIIDPLNGVKAIQDKKIEFIGNCEDRINQDHLRILRYIRFINRFNLKYNNEEMEMIIKNLPLLNEISNERIRDEILKILKDGINDYSLFHKIVQYDGEIKILDYFKLLKNTYKNHPMHKRDNVLDHTFDLINQYISEGKSDEDMLWCLLFHDMYKPRTLNTDEEITRFFNHDIVYDDFDEIISPFILKKNQKNYIKFFITVHLKANFVLRDIRTDNINHKTVFNLFWYFYNALSKKYKHNFNLFRPILATENNLMYEEDFTEYLNILEEYFDQIYSVVHKINKKQILETLKNPREFKKKYQQICKKEWVLSKK